MERWLSISACLLFTLTSCRQHSDDLNIRDDVDHWETSKTYVAYNRSSLLVDTVENEYKVVNGQNQILVVTIEDKPIFKEGKELSDLYSTISLVIELDSADSLVNVQSPSNSRLFRKLTAFSPDYGIRPLQNDEQITLTRKDASTWIVDSRIQDFVFKGEVNFLTNQIRMDKLDDD